MGDDDGDDNYNDNTQAQTSMMGSSPLGNSDIVSLNPQKLTLNELERQNTILKRAKES